MFWGPEIIIIMTWTKRGLFKARNAVMHHQMHQPDIMRNTHSECQVMSEGGGIEVLEDGVLKVWQLQAYRWEKSNCEEGNKPCKKFITIFPSFFFTFVRPRAALLHFLLQVLHLFFQLFVLGLCILQFAVGQERPKNVTPHSMDNSLKVPITWN